MTPRQLLALQMDKAGISHGEIARRLGIRHRQAASRLVARARQVERQQIELLGRMLDGSGDGT